MNFMKFSFLIVLSTLVQGIPKAWCQQINLYSISTARQTSGDNGYTLDGAFMVSSRQKLLNANNFGSAGIYPRQIVITDTFSTTGSFTSINQMPGIDILFFGSFNKIDATFKSMTAEELDSLYKWSKNGGKMIICEQPPGSGFDNSILDERWGFSLFLSPSSIYVPTAEGMASDIFNGPFGAVNTAQQGGSSVGYIDTFQQNSIVLARNQAGYADIILDCNTLDLICADVDGYTTLGGVTPGQGINVQQDKFWANTIAYMDKLESTPSPTIAVNGNELSVGSYYISYQWYLNGMLIPDANSSTYTANESGEYTVEVTYSCGCIVKAPSVEISIAPLPVIDEECRLFVPTAFSPNSDGTNDYLHILQNGISSVDFRIFDRWGEKVFETTDVSEGWNGIFRGEKLNTGVFVYSLEATCDKSGEKIFRKGNVTLVR